MVWRVADNLRVIIGSNTYINIFNRSQFSPLIKNNSFGFRCAKDSDRKGAK